VPANLLALLQTIFAAFVVGNSVEYIGGAFKKKEDLSPSQTQESTTTSTEAADTRMEELEATVKRTADGLSRVAAFLADKEKAMAEKAAKNRAIING
jgi:uncharacterized coiled-coil protein SlyX